MIAVFVWVRTVAYSFYNKLLFDHKEKSYISTFSLFTITYYLPKIDKRFSEKVKREKRKSKNRQASVETCRFLAGAEGLEPTTPSFGDWCSTD